MSEVGSNRRNFRVAYYDKVGCRGIGEKALAAILRDDVVDRKKLENFCIRFSIPPSFRMLVWKILLNILPVHQQSHKFVMKQRAEQYDDLYRAVKALHAANELPHDAEIHLKMYLIENGEVNLTCGLEGWNATFAAITCAINEMADLPADVYWLSVKFYEFFKTNSFALSENEFQSILLNTLEKESVQLFHHLAGINFFSGELLKSWYRCGFAGTLPSEGLLDKVWDILLARGGRVLSYIGAHVLLAFERHLLLSATPCACAKVLVENVQSDNVSDLIVHRGIEAFKKYEKIV